MSLRRAVLSAMVCAGILTLAPAQLGAQVRGGAEVRGTVSDMAGRAIAGARILRNGGQDTAWTDAAGRYRFTRLAHGLHEFVFAVVGYQGAMFELSLYSDTVVTVNVALEPSRAVLEEIVIVGDSMEEDLLAIGFLARRRNNEGSDATFIGPEEISRRRALRLGHLLQQQRNMRIEYQMSRAIPRGRGGRCIMSVWLDGQQVRGLFGEDGGQADPQGLDFISPSSVLAIEVYPSPSSTPPQFQAQNSCGAIVIWTKR